MLAFATGTTIVNGSGGAALVVPLFVFGAISVLEIAAFWRLFTKAGRPGWASLIPIYNGYVLLKIAGRPGWWLVLYVIPFVNFVIAVIVVHELSKSFGHGGGFTLGLVVLPWLFYPLIAFGSDRYLGPGGIAGALVSSSAPGLPPPPGWYPDPSNPGSQRWWDGQQWSPSTSGWHGPGS